jgi:thiol-disulfide isomerase/thioredoxin
MKTFLWRWVALVLGSVACASGVRGAESAVAFRAITFEAATQAAVKENKLIFIDFFTTWCEPCKRLDTQTWTDAAVGKLVGEKAVALKLDAEKEGKALAQRYKVEAYPTLLLLKADGTAGGPHRGVPRAGDVCGGVCGERRREDGVDAGDGCGERGAGGEQGGGAGALRSRAHAGAERATRGGARGIPVVLRRGDAGRAGV